MWRRASVLILMVTSEIGAQDPHVGRNDVMAVVGLSVAAYQTSHPEGGPAGRGGSLGVARRLGSQGGIRMVVTGLSTWVTADETTACALSPGGG